MTERKSRVLLVDDERGIRAALRRVLVQGDFEVVTAASGEEAVRAIETEPEFDVVLTDLKMPGMHGLELMRAVRGIDPNVAIVVLTGHRDAHSTATLEQAGAAAYLDKPVEGDVLLRTLRDLLQEGVSVARSERRPTQAARPANQSDSTIHEPLYQKRS